MKTGLDSITETPKQDLAEDLSKIMENTHIETIRNIPEKSDENAVKGSPILDKNPPPMVLNFDSESFEISPPRCGGKRENNFTPLENVKRLKVLHSLNETMAGDDCLRDGTPLNDRQLKVRRNLFAQFGSLENDNQDDDYVFIEPDSTIDFVTNNLDSMDQIMDSFIRYNLDTEYSSYQHFVFQTTLSNSIPVFLAGTVQFVNEIEMFEPTRKLAFAENEKSTFLMENYEYRLEVIHFFI